MVYLLLIFISIIIPSSSLASEQIRVLLSDQMESVTIESRTGLLLEHSPLRPVGNKVTIGSGYLGTSPVRITSKDGLIRLNGRAYRGSIEIRKGKDSKLIVINELDLEEYLMGVVAEEIPHDWEAEALKAQAVVSRTYALYLKKRAGKRPYHITSDVKTQVYGGRRAERESTVRAVRETEGLVLTHKGEVIPAFYHSSCGGRTEDASELWNIDASYLKGVDCACQEISKYGEWERRISIKDALIALSKLGHTLSDITSIDLGRITQAGRVKNLAIRDKDRMINVPAEKFRLAIGSSVIPSVFFEASLSGREMVISGRGMGHGVGLCQWGAKNMAQKGSDYITILQHYYPGTTIERW